MKRSNLGSGCALRGKKNPMLRSAACAFMAIALVCVSSLARAQEDYSRVGCYLGLAGTVAFLRSAEDLLERTTGLSADVNESLGLHARAGCRGMWGGAEVHFEWLEGFDGEVDGVDIDQADGWALTLDVKLYPLAGLEGRLPALARRFQPFATVGAGYLTLDAFDGESDFVGRFGGGLDVYVTRNIVINVDATYVLPASDSLCGEFPSCEGDDLAYLSVGWGLLYRF